MPMTLGEVNAEVQPIVDAIRNKLNDGDDLDVDVFVLAALVLLLMKLGDPAP